MRAQSDAHIAADTSNLVNIGVNESLLGEFKWINLECDE